MNSAAQDIDLMTGKVIPKPSSPTGATKPWYNVVIRMHVQGYANKEIADCLDKHTDEITKILISPWGKEQVSAAIMEDENAAFRILEATNLDNIYALMQLRDFGSTDSVRLNAAKELMHMSLGKPRQRIENTTAPETDVTKAAAQVEAEIEALEGKH